MLTYFCSILFRQMLLFFIHCSEKFTYSWWNHYLSLANTFLFINRTNITALSIKIKMNIHGSFFLFFRIHTEFFWCSSFTNPTTVLFGRGLFMIRHYWFNSLNSMHYYSIRTCNFFCIRVNY